jgi:hypothetical protein
VVALERTLLNDGAMLQSRCSETAASREWPRTAIKTATIGACLCGTAILPSLAAFLLRPGQRALLPAADPDRALGNLLVRGLSKRTQCPQRWRAYAHGYSETRSKPPFHGVLMSVAVPPKTYSKSFPAS